MKKSLSLFISAILLISSVAVFPVSAKTKFLKKDGFVYVLSGDEAHICFYYGKSKTVTYPSQIKGHKVTKIGWDYDDTIDLEREWDKSGDSNIKPNTKIKSAQIPDTVKELGLHCFDGFKKLKSVRLSNSLKKIPAFCFYGCESLGSVTVPNGVKTLEWCAFFNCSKLSAVSLPDSIREIENFALAGTNLNSLKLTKNIKKLGSSEKYYAWVVFENSAIKEITVDSRNKTFSSKDGVLYNKKKTLLCYYPDKKADKTFTVPKTVTKIHEYAFENCKKLNNVIISKNVKSIGENAFSNCTKLSKLTFKTNKLTTIKAWTFSGCESLKSVKLPSCVRKVGMQAFLNCEKLTSLTTGKNLTKIGEGSFYSCKSLTKINLNTKAELTIGEEAFYGCNSLKSVTIPANVKKIGWRAFGYFHHDLPEGADEDDPDIIISGPIKGFTIKGEPNTPAEKYAKKNKFKFTVKK